MKKMKISQRTQKAIKTLHPLARDWATAHIEAIMDSKILPNGYTVEIISAHRSYTEQNRLYAQGRSKPGRIVTNARGGQSNHNFGVAWDIGIFKNGQYLGNSKYYKELGDVGLKLGLLWGGRWRSFKDYPHYEVNVGLSLSQKRSYVARGKTLPVPKYKGLKPEPITNSVLVKEQDVDTSIKAFLENGRTFVAVRPFIERFGGKIVSATGTGFVVTLDDEIYTIPGRIIDGTGYVKFVDVNLITQWNYSFSGNVLSIWTTEGQK